MPLRATKIADLSQAQNPAAFTETDELFLCFQIHLQLPAFNLSCVNCNPSRAILCGTYLIIKGVLPCVNLQLIYLKQLCAVVILHRVLPAFCAEHSRNVLEKRTGLPCFPMPLTVGKTHRLPPEQLHFTQGIPAPLPRRDPHLLENHTG